MSGKIKRQNEVAGGALIQQGKLWFYCFRIQPQVTRDINWEDHDLLFKNGGGNKLANYLALMDTSDALVKCLNLRL